MATNIPFAPAVAADRSFVSSLQRFVRTPLVLVGVLLLMLLGNWIFKTKLEDGNVRFTVHVPPECFESTGKLLLPYDFAGRFVRWSPTGLLLATILDQQTSPETTILVLSSLLVVVAFITSWLAFRSWSFTLTFTLIMTFGAQFNLAWVNASCSVYYLFVAYALANLLCLHSLIARPTERPWLARGGFVVSLLLLALCWETWLDYFVFLCAICAIGQFLTRRFPNPEMRRSLNFIAVATVAIVVPYLAVRLSFGGEQGRPGAEAELLFKHRYVALMIDDFVANVITYTYMAFVNFIPHGLAGSNALTALSDETLVQGQNGYHPQAQHLVPGHYHYFWHFQAGMVFVAFAYFLGKLLVRNYQRPTRASLILLALGLLVAAGYATHSLIKFRPYMSLPVLSYKATLSIVGAALLISYCAKLAWERWAFTRPGVGLLIGIWSVIFYCSLTHAAWQEKMLPRVGVESPPNPLRSRMDRLLEAGQNVKAVNLPVRTSDQ